MSDLHYTRLDSPDLPAVAALHGPVTPRRGDPALLRWQFFDDALPTDGILVGAWDGKRLVGTQAFIPLAARIGERPLLSAKSELTLVDPAYRGRGVFEAMYALGFEECRKAGVDCIWGFTSAVKPFRAVGFETRGPLYEEYILLRPLRAALARRFPPSPLPALNASPPAGAWHGEGFPLDGEARSTPVARFHIPRTGDHLRYRYERNPYVNVVGADTEHGVLYTQDPARTDVVRVAEVGADGALQESLRDFIPRQSSGWKALYRFTNRPLPMGLVEGRAIALHRVSPACIVWTWLGERAGQPCPSFAIEEGYREGV